MAGALGRRQQMPAARAQPQPAEQHQGRQRREIGGRRVAEEPGIARGGEERRGDVVPEDHAGEGGEQDPLDDDDAGGGRGRPRPEGALDPAAQALPE